MVLKSTVPTIRPTFSTQPLFKYWNQSRRSQINFTLSSIDRTLLHGLLLYINYICKFLPLKKFSFELNHTSQMRCKNYFDTYSDGSSKNENHINDINIILFSHALFITNLHENIFCRMLLTCNHSHALVFCRHFSFTHFKIFFVLWVFFWYVTWLLQVIS